jgi:DNA-directed RNA polymerase specialized sigma24 family protein
MEFMRIEGYVSKKNIRRWLDNYEALAVGDRPADAVPTNSGPKNYDGVSGGRLNKIMLDDAIKKLPRLQRACVTCKWIRQLRPAEALRLLGITKAEYTAGCNAAVDSIYASINGPIAGVKQLMQAIAAQ